MSLVEEIQAGAADGTTPLPSVLRKTLILAYRLNHIDLKNWVESELNGYSDDTALPDYRKHVCQSFAYIRNPYVGELQNAGVITAGQPQHVRDFIDRPVEFRQGIATLDSLVDSDNDLQQLWPTDLCIRHAAHGYIRFDALKAWKLIPNSIVVGITDAVRNRLLMFVLELEQQAPQVANDADMGAIPKGVVAQIFNTYIIGDNNQVRGSDGPAEVTK